MSTKTNNQNTNKSILATLGTFNIGYANITGENRVTATLFSKPTTDINIVWLIRGAEPLQSFEKTEFSS